jgi:hypothetical protein
LFSAPAQILQPNQRRSQPLHLELEQRERFIRAGEVAGASQTFQNRSRFNGLSA